MIKEMISDIYEEVEKKRKMNQLIDKRIVQ